MKKIVGVVLLLCLIGGGIFVYSDRIGFLQLGEVEYLTQIITEDMKHSRTISWQAKQWDDSFKIEYKKKGSFSTQSKKWTGMKMPVTQGEERFIYRVHLDQLDAGSEYEYRIVSGWKKSTWKSFQTEPEENKSFKAIIFGDSQSGDYSLWGKTSQAGWEKNQDASFFIGMGDLVDNGQQVFQWDSWYNQGASLFARLPISPLMGNHEAYSLDWQMVRPENYLALFSLPNNGPDGLKGYAYSYDYGEVHFVVLSTLIKELKEFEPELFEKQKKWLAQDLGTTKKKWKIVLMHHGLWRFPFNGSFNEIGQTFMPVFDEYQVDLVFSGHVHSYSRSFPLKDGMKSDQGTAYVSTGRSGDRVWPRSPGKPLDAVFYNPIDQPNYLTLEASQESLQVKAFNLDGTSIDQVKIEK